MKTGLTAVIVSCAVFGFTVSVAQGQEYELVLRNGNGSGGFNETAKTLDIIIGAHRDANQTVTVKLMNVGAAQITGKIELFAEITGGPPTQKNLGIRITSVQDSEAGMKNVEWFTAGGCGRTFDYTLFPGQQAIYRVHLRSNDLIPLNAKVSATLK